MGTVWYFLVVLMLFLRDDLHVRCTKMYSGQRIFNDYHMVEFIDTAKHGFHIILDQHFVDTHLQPNKLPTVFATAIPLLNNRPELTMTTNRNRSSTSASAPPVSRRVTKILYPENGEPENGLLDGRVIKLMGLQERSWYYVCIEFESNLNRHEMATGLTCQLKRTLNKFGKTVETTVSEIELLEITDRSITIQLKMEVDFPLSLVVFLEQEDLVPESGGAKSIPAQTFVIDSARTLRVQFGPASSLKPDTSYGRLCVLEEPLLYSNVYTAMGREARASLRNCYFDNLKTKPARLPKKQGYDDPLQEYVHNMAAHEPEIRQASSYKTSRAARTMNPSLCVVAAIVFSFCLLSGHMCSIV